MSKLAKRVVTVFATMLPLFIPPSVTCQIQSYLLDVGKPGYTITEPVEFGYVNLANGNLHLEIPVYSSPQRGKIPFVAKMVYDSRIWLHVLVNSQVWVPTNVLNSQGGASWGGWRFVTSADGGSVNAPQTDTTCTVTVNGHPVQEDQYVTFYPFNWTAPDGTFRSFPISTQQYVNPNCPPVTNNPTGNAFANDGSGYHMYVTNYNSAVIYAPDGTQVFPGIEDANGNLFSADSNGNTIDTLGRTPLTKSVNGSVITYSVLTSQHPTTAPTIQITTETINAHTNFQQSYITECSTNCTLTVVKSLSLPDGSSYSFTYDSGTTAGHYGVLTGITLRTGGALNYTYTNFADASGQKNLWLNTRVSGGGTWTYMPAVVSGIQQLTVTKPDGNAAVHFFTVNNGAWQSSASYYTGSVSSGTLLRSLTASFDFSNSCSPSPCTGNSYIHEISQVSNYPSLGGSTLHQQTTFTFDNPQYGNVTKLKEWQFYTGSPGAIPDRETDITYQTSSSYIAKNIITLPLSMIINGAGTQLTSTTLTYDDPGTLTSTPGIVNHDDTNFGISNTVRGNETSVTVAANSTTNVKSTNTYDTTGQTLTNVDPAGNSVSLGYGDNYFVDNGSNPPESFSPSTATNAYLTSVTRPYGAEHFGYYFYSGKEALSEDVNSQFTYQHYADNWDRPTLTQGPTGSWVLTNYTSSTEKDVYSSITDTTPAPTCSGCKHEETIADGLGRETEHTLANDAPSSTSIVAVFDSTSRLQSTSNPYRSTSDPTYGLTTYAYDGINRTTKTTYADASSDTRTYGAAISGGASTQLCPTSSPNTLGYPILTVDPTGKKRQQWISGFGKIIEVDEPDSSGNLTVNTCFVYDALNNLLQVTQGGETKTYTYDGLSRTLTATTPEAGLVSFSYLTSAGAFCSGDPASVCIRNDARPETITYLYDTANRLTSQSYSDGSTPAVSRFYDQTSYNGLTISNGKGRLTGMSDASGQTAWTYDAIGHIVTERRTINGVTKTISYAYNLGGLVSSLTYPSGRIITYSYNPASKQTAAVDTANSINYATTGMYTPHGAVSSVVYGETASFAGMTVSYSFNSRLQFTGITATSPSSALLSLSYGFGTAGSNNGTAGSETNSVSSGHSQTFTYDPLNRLISAQSQDSTQGASDCWGQSFGAGGLAADRWNNLTSISVTKCSAPSLAVSANAQNQLSFSGATYDAIGDTTNDGTSAYTWNGEAQAKTAAGVTYTYDGNNLRVEKSSGTLYWRDINGNVLAETSLSGALQNEYVFLSGRRIAFRNSAGSIYYYFTDRIGSTRVVTTSTGAVCYSADFMPYGKEIAYTNTCLQNYKFRGAERDTETGNDYATGRYYSATLARFLNPDPIFRAPSNPQLMNRYTLPGRNSINVFDRTVDLLWADSQPSLRTTECSSDLQCLIDVGAVNVAALSRTSAVHPTPNHKGPPAKIYSYQFNIGGLFAGETSFMSKFALPGDNDKIKILSLTPDADDPTKNSMLQWSSGDPNGFDDGPGDTNSSAMNAWANEFSLSLTPLNPDGTPSGPAATFPDPGSCSWAYDPASASPCC
jgi:RHS repeat-associated protein